MKNKGFTLIELLGVIIILALLMIIVFPSIVNSVKNSSNKTDDLTKELIYNATDLFIDQHVNHFPKMNGSKYSILLSDLVNEGLLTGPIKLSSSDADITNNKCIQVTYDNGYNYELKEIGTCKEIIKYVLPQEYQQVKYIESTGTQYIDTGYVVKEDDELELSYKITELSKPGDKMLFGAKKSETGGQLWIETYNEVNRWYVRFGSTTSINANSESTQYEGTLILRKNELIVNGKKIISPVFENMPTTTLELFGRTNENNVLTGGYVQIRNFKITRNSLTIRHFIPCYRKLDNVVGMYDVVNNIFYTNAGTGTFIKGDNV